MGLCAIRDGDIVPPIHAVCIGRTMVARVVLAAAPAFDLPICRFADLPANAGAEVMSMPVLLAAEPQLFVADIGVSCAFYTGKLGFAVAFTYGEPAFYAQVYRDGARLNLRCLEKPAIDPHLRDSEDLLCATITLDDAQALFVEFQAAAMAFHQPLKEEPWGARTFIVRDPDGNLLLFASRAA